MRDFFNLCFSLSPLTIWLLVVIGWVINVVDVITTLIGVEDFSTFNVTGEFILNVVGVFLVPLGSIMGLFVW